MKLSYVDVLGDGQRHEVTATITTDHSASSYGQSVIVLDTDGEALDITSWVLLNYQIVDATTEEFELLKRVLIVDPRMAAVALGSVTSERKAKSSRENAKKGGWPKGKPRKPKVE